MASCAHAARTAATVGAHKEIRRLYGKLILAGHTAVGRVLYWSDWRSRRQAQAKASHYRKRLKLLEGHDIGLQY